MKALLSKTEPRLATTANKQEGVLSWDSDNNYPQRMEDITADSVTGTSCLRIYTKFIMGRGVADETFYKAVINRNGLRVDQFLRKMAESKAFIGAMACHVNFNGAYDVVEVTAYPIKDVRITIDRQKAAIHPDWAKRDRVKKFNKKDIQLIYWWNPDPIAIQSQVDACNGGTLEEKWANYQGQVYYWSPNGIEYSIAVYDPAAEDMKTEGQLKLVRYRSAAQNFLASQIVVVDAPEQREEGEEQETNGRNSDIETSNSQVIADTLSEFQGADNTGAVMIVEKTNPDDTFEVIKMDLQSYDDMYTNTRQGAKDSIVESFLMPKALLLEGANSLGNSLEMELAKDFYNDITSDDRLVMEEMLREIFSRWETPICPTDDYSVLPILVNKAITQEYFAYFTKNEIRVSLGMPELEETPKLLDILGVAGAQAVTAVLGDTALTPEQKGQSLQLIYGLTTQQANQLLGL